MPTLSASGSIKRIPSFAATVPRTNGFDGKSVFAVLQGDVMLSRYGYAEVFGPAVTNSTFVDEDSLNVYAEVYNSDKFMDQFYFVSVFLSKANSTSPAEGFQRTLKIAAKGLDVITTGFNISALPFKW